MSGAETKEGQDIESHTSSSANVHGDPSDCILAYWFSGSLAESIVYGVSVFVYLTTAPPSWNSTQHIAGTQKKGGG